MAEDLAPNKRRDRLRLVTTKAQFRSAITNGRLLDRELDGRGAFMRRLRDLIYQHEADLGGGDNLSEGQRSIIRHAAQLEIELEKLQLKFGASEGAASSRDLETYQRTANSLRRLLESLDLHKGRKPKPVPSLADFLRAKQQLEGEAAP